MKITENTFIDILGLPEWDDRVLEVLDALELERPVLKEGEVDKFLHSKKYGIELFFDNIAITELQKELTSTNTLFLDHVSFDKDTILPMPFNIKMEDDYKTIIEKIGRKPDVKATESETTFIWDFPYKRFVVNFEHESLNSLKEFWFRMW